MATPIYTTSSRALLQRFFARESRRALLVNSNIKNEGGASSTIVSSDLDADVDTPQASTSRSSTATTNPFASTLSRNAVGRPRYQKATYSLRRQKQLLRAMDIVKLQEELFTQDAGPSAIKTNEQQQHGSSEEGVEGVVVDVNSNKSDWTVPASWILPSSVKANSMPSFAAQLQSAATNATSSSTSPSSLSAAADSTSTSSPSPSSSSTLSSQSRAATQRGPYKGRRGPAFKQHRWERQKESILKEREEKIKNMPQRIDEYTKVCRPYSSYLQALEPHVLTIFPILLLLYILCRPEQLLGGMPNLHYHFR